MPSGYTCAALVAACSVALLASGALSGKASATVPTAPTDAATPLRWHALPLTTIAGQPATVPAMQDGPVLLQFWASWCHSCGGLMWELDSLAAAHPQVPYLAVSIDADPADAARVTAHPLHARHPTRYLHDGTGALARYLRVQVVPTIIVLDASGRERLRHVGHVNSSDLQRLRATLDTIAPPSATSPEKTP